MTQFMLRDSKTVNVQHTYETLIGQSMTNIRTAI